MSCPQKQLDDSTVNANKHVKGGTPPLALGLDTPVLHPTHVRFFFLPLYSPKCTCYVFPHLVCLLALNRAKNARVAYLTPPVRRQGNLAPSCDRISLSFLAKQVRIYWYWYQVCVKCVHVLVCLKVFEIYICVCVYVQSN